jgi:hypothetical protein
MRNKWLVARGWWLELVLAALIVGTGSTAQAQNSYWGSPDDPLVKQIIASEKMWLDAECSRRPGLKDVIADDYQGTAPDGERTDKASALSDSPGWPAKDCQLGPVKVRFFSESLAMVYGSESTVRTAKDGTAAKRCLVWTDTWMKRAGKWQIIAAQDMQVKCQ